jgi:phage terminase large subunit
VFKTSVLYEANYNSKADIVINQGGSSSGKTYSILQVLFTHLISERNIITVIGQDIPNLKAGALRDALDIYENSDILKSEIEDYNKTDRIFLAKNGSIMEFKSFQSAQDAKSGKRDYSFFNEANGIRKDVFEQVEIRTKKQTFIDYNPDAEFWVHEDLIGKPNTELLISDHRHNPFCPQKIRDKLEGLRFKDMDLFKVYGRGMTGKIEGLVYRNYNIVEDVPLGADLIAAWLDWGFTNDPTSFGKVYKFNGELYLDELIYETNLTNSDIIAKLKHFGVTRHQEIIADSSEPKSIEDLRRAGFRINGANKGPDSIRNGIDTLKQYVLNITQRSVGLKKEIKSYKWDLKNPNEPIDFNNHSLDGIRYVALNKINKNSGKYFIYG